MIRTITSLCKMLVLPLVIAPLVLRAISRYVTVTQVAVGLVDCKGNHARSQLHVVSDTAGHLASYLTGLRPLIEALTNCAWAGISGDYGFTTAHGLYGDTGSEHYRTVEDRLRLTFVTDPQQSIVHFGIPAPKQAALMADGETVSSANADVSALTDYLTTALDTGATYASNRAGQSLNVFIGGIRTRSRLRRRMNIFIKQPDLSATPAE